MAFGTLAVPDLIRTANANILDFGERRLYEYIGRLVAAHNQITRDLLGTFVTYTTERIMGYGGSSGVQMVETNEWGRADVSKPTTGGNIGLPLRLYQTDVQWTKKWLQNHEPIELVAVMQDVLLVDTQNTQKALKTAIFGSSNYAFVDHLVDRYSLSVKALANADSFNLPPDPYGNTFNGATHTHYLARAGGALAAADVDALIATVTEHFNRGRPVVYIPSGLEATVRGFNATGQFLALQPVTTNLGANAAIAVGSNLETAMTNNRRIGYWGNQAAEVWVKPWMPANYLLCMMQDAGTDVLGFRERQGGQGDLVLAVEDENYPLRARAWEREFGLAVVDRVSAAVSYAGGTSYVDPVF
jgi:hypothetical protein